MINEDNVCKFDKRSLRKELFEELQKYKCVINSWMIDYMNSLLTLEFSVVRENISKDEREVLS